MKIRWPRQIMLRLAVTVPAHRVPRQEIFVKQDIVFASNNDLVRVPLSWKPGQLGLRLFEAAILRQVTRVDQDVGIRELRFIVMCV
jgi:hypothetical protein